MGHAPLGMGIAADTIKTHPCHKCYYTSQRVGIDRGEEKTEECCVPPSQEGVWMTS